MKKKILLTTDFSKNSWNAIQYAIKLYENQNCDFYILNTFTKDTHGRNKYTLLDPDEGFNKLSEKRSMQGLGDIMVRLTFENDNPNHRFYTLSRSNLFLDAVQEVVKSLQIDMIVMGAKGMANEQQGKYGKNTLAVIENVRKCPVLIVPRQVTFNQPEEIVLATNFSSDFKVAEIKYLAEIAKMTNAKIQVLSLANDYLTPQQKKNKVYLQKFLEDIDHSFSVRPKLKTADSLSSFADIEHSDMISYIAQKPSFWEKFGFSKPVLGKLGYHENVPVLALHG